MRGSVLERPTLCDNVIHKGHKRVIVFYLYLKHLSCHGMEKGDNKHIFNVHYFSIIVQTLSM